MSGVPLEHILKCGQWKSTNTFVKFYDKELLRFSLEATQQFAGSILDHTANDT